MAVLVACGQDSSLSLRSLWALQDIYHSFSYVLNAGGVLSVMPVSRCQGPALLRMLLVEKARAEALCDLGQVA